jgi:hypothetical protein
MVDPDTGKLSCYLVSYTKLKLLGVSFPKVIYFDYDEIAQHIPESSVTLSLT